MRRNSFVLNMYYFLVCARAELVLLHLETEKVKWVKFGAQSCESYIMDGVMPTWVICIAKSVVPFIDNVAE